MEEIFTATVNPPQRHLEHASLCVLFKINVWHREISSYNKFISNVPRFRRYAFSPAAVKQKAKEGLERLGGALFYPSVKRSPCAFGFCVWWV
jgi:hypothetical protein